MRRAKNLNFITNLALCLVFLLNINSSLAHPGSKYSGLSPIRSTKIIGPNGEAKRLKSGYGFIIPTGNSDSEAEAYELGAIDCSSEAQADYYCQNNLPHKATWDDSFISKYIDPITTDLIRKKWLERAILERAVLVKDENILNFPAKDIWPSCIKGDFLELKKVREDSYNLVKKIKSEKALQKADQQNRDKIKALTNTFSSGNLIHSFLFENELNTNLKEAIGNKSNNEISDLKNQLNKFNDNPSILFSQSSESKINKVLFQEAIGEFLGEFDPATSGKGRPDKLKAGSQVLKAFHQAGVKGSSIDSFQKLEEHLFSLMSKAQQPPFQARLAKLQNSIDQIKKRHIKNLENDWQKICQRSLSDLVLKSPNTVRQVLVESAKNSSGPLKLSLCKNGLGSKLAPIKQCQGITKELDASGEPFFKANLTNFTFPYVSEVGYSYFPKKSPPLVKLNMNMISEITPKEEFKKMISEWKNKLEDFYNCESGVISNFGPVTSGDKLLGSEEIMKKRNCPSNPDMPKMRFEINLNPVHICNPPETGCFKSFEEFTAPGFRINKCFRTELPSPQNRNCEEVRKYAIEKCVKELDQSIQTRGASSDVPEFDLLLKNKIDPIEKLDKKYQNACAGTPRFDPATCDQKKNICEKNICLAQAYCLEFPLWAKENGKYVVCANQENDMKNKICDGRMTSFGEIKKDPYPLGASEYDRENAGNLSTKTPLSVLAHEFGHRMGFNDEYEDPTYPIQVLGEESSIMNYTGPHVRLYPRHLKNIINIDKCFDTKEKSK